MDADPAPRGVNIPRRSTGDGAEEMIVAHGIDGQVPVAACDIDPDAERAIGAVAATEIERAAELAVRLEPQRGPRQRLVARALGHEVDRPADPPKSPKSSAFGPSTISTRS